MPSRMLRRVFCLFLAAFFVASYGLRQAFRVSQVLQRSRTHRIEGSFTHKATVMNEATIKESINELGLTLEPRRFRKATKQLATLGPASNSQEMIEKLFLSGADIFRLNFSHGEHAEKAALVKLIREIERKYNHPIAILADLQGPKLRVGLFANNKVNLKEGQLFTFDLRDVPGDETRVRLPHPEILNTLQRGDILLLDDGKLKMKVVSTTMATAATPEEGAVQCEVIVGGNLSNKKGVNTPTVILPISPLTAKDKKDLAFILTLDVDWVALSFVQQPADMVEFRSLTNGKVKLMAKLEKPSALGHLDEIVGLSDGVMVARGDLGVEMNPWDVPVLQKRIVETCKLLGKPVVIATQMMESMIENPTPTRAEASDCATAIYESCDAVMLSAESAAGKWPIESVTMQQRIINRVETDEAFRTSLDRFALEVDLLDTADATSAAISLAARQVADVSQSKAIVAFTASGNTALRMAKLRPKVPVVAVCEDIRIARQLALVWGVYPVLVEKHVGEFIVNDAIRKACKVIVDNGFADPRTDLLTVTIGLPWGTPGTTNIIRVCAAAGPDFWTDQKGVMREYKDTANGSQLK